MKREGKSRSVAESLEHIGYLHAQGARKPLHILDRDVSLPALDTADVGSVQAGQLGQPFLRQTQFDAPLQDRRAEMLFDVGWTFSFDSVISPR